MRNDLQNHPVVRLPGVRRGGEAQTMTAPKEMSAAEYRKAVGLPIKLPVVKESLTTEPPRHARAHARRQPGTMNKTEAEYAAHLEAEKRAGNIIDYRFEAVKLRLADKTFYTPDFFVVAADGFVEFREVKGFWEDDARVKIKVAAEQHWWARFTAVSKLAQKRGGGWKIETF